MSDSWEMRVSRRYPKGDEGSAVLRKSLNSPEVVFWPLIRRDARTHSVYIATVSSASVIQGRTESEPKPSSADLGTCLCWDHHFRNNKIKPGSFFPHARFCVSVTPGGKAAWPAAHCKQSLTFYFGMFQVLSGGFKFSKSSYLLTPSWPLFQISP